MKLTQHSYVKLKKKSPFVRENFLIFEIVFFLNKDFYVFWLIIFEFSKE